MSACSPSGSGPSPAAPLRPLCWAALTLGVGSLGGSGLGSDWTWPALAGLGFLLGLGLARRSRVPRWAPWMLFFAAWRASGSAAPPGLAPARPGELQEARAEPLLGRWQPWHAGRGGWLEPAPGAPRTLGHHLLLEPLGPAPEAGELVCVLPGGEVLPWPRGSEGPASARTRSFLALSTVRPDELLRLEGAARTPLAGVRRLLAYLRHALGERVAGLEREHSAGLLRALLTGERGGLSPERADLFARTGTSHLLAISGWHVGLFAALVLLPLSRGAARIAGLRDRAERGLGLFLARIFCLALFAALVGGGEPVLRAALALALALLAPALPRHRADPRGTPAAPRRPDGLSLLAAAFSCECLRDPSALGSLSLALSYAATLGLLLGTGPLAALAGARRDPWDELGHAPLVRLARLFAKVARRTLAAGIGASVAAVLATLPISWWTFGETTPAGPLLTFLALPPFTALCLCSWTGAVLPLDALAGPSELCARALYGVLALGDHLPGTPLPLPPRPPLLVAAATGLVFLALRRPRARAAAAFLWGILLLPWSAAPRGLELEVADVGHGTAALLRAPGLEALVFDAGSRDRRGLYPEALAPLLARWEVSRPLVVLSHPDQDHGAALGRLSERYPPRAFLGARPAQSAVRLPHDALELDLDSGRVLLPGMARELRIRVLRGSNLAGNEGSRSLEVLWCGERLLLCGDAEGPGLLCPWLAEGPTRLLLYPHHGSESPFLGPLLEATDPEEVWISSAARPPIAAELDRRGLPWRWTGRAGPLALRLP